MGGTGGSAGSSGAGGTGGAAANDAGPGDGPSGCAVVLTPVATARSFDGLEAGPDAKLRVSGEVIRPGPQPPVWTWMVTFIDGSPVPVTEVGGVPSLIEFPLAKPGQYAIRATVTSGLFCERNVVATAISPGPASFVFRATPPRSSNLPVQDIKTMLPAGSQDIYLDLKTGDSITLSPQDTDGEALPAYVRITSVSSSFSVEGHTRRAPLTAVLLPVVSYDVLVIPDGPIAPILVGGTVGDLSTPMVLDPGVVVSGRLLDAQGGPLVGGRVLLRAGSRPSTLAESDASGGYALLTRSGSLSVTIMPPAAAGLPEARLDGSPGVLLGPGTPSLGLDMRWKALPTARLSVAVTGSDGAPAAGARLLLQSEVAIAEVGTLSVGPPGGMVSVLPVSGRMRVEVDADTTGTVTFPALPRGRYRAVVVPPPTLVGAAVTSGSFDISSGDRAAALTLGRKVKLNGTLLPADLTRGARITALPTATEVIMAATSAEAGVDGRFELEVDPGRSYKLLASPRAGQPVGRASREISVAGPSASTGVWELPDASIFRGSVASGGRPVPDTLIQVFCVGPSATCADPSFALAEVVSGSDGTFRVVLPQ
jgi:hypothetical protein